MGEAAEPVRYRTEIVKKMASEFAHPATIRKSPHLTGLAAPASSPARPGVRHRVLPDIVFLWTMRLVASDPSRRNQRGQRGFRFEGPRMGWTVEMLS